MKYELSGKLITVLTALTAKIYICLKENENEKDENKKENVKNKNLNLRIVNIIQRQLNLKIK